MTDNSSSYLWAARVNLARAERAEAEIERLRQGIQFALDRYENPAEPHNKVGGFPRGQIAWAMAMDLRNLLKPVEEETEEETSEH